MKERFYDRLNGPLDRRGFGARRDRLVGELTGEVLEIGAGTGLNLPRYRRASRPGHPAIRDAVQGSAVKA